MQFDKGKLLNLTFLFFVLDINLLLLKCLLGNYPQRCESSYILHKLVVPITKTPSKVHDSKINLLELE